MKNCEVCKEEEVNNISIHDEKTPPIIEYTCDECARQLEKERDTRTV